MAESLPHIAHPPSLVAVDVSSDRSLSITVEERSGHGPAAMDELGLESREIIGAIGDRTFEISWSIVVCFAVRGDPFPKGGPSTATICEIALEDAFLTWVKSDSHVEPDYIAAMQADPDAPALKLRHWQVSCNEALIDIASPLLPVVRQISR
jgi:hypothetical protein